MKKRLLENLLYPLCGITVIIAVWAVCAEIYGKPLILPKFTDTAKSFFCFFAEGEFYSAMAMTFLRSLLCFVVALIFATGLALLSALCRQFEMAFAPVIGILRSAPTMAVLLVALVVLTSSTVPIFVGFLTVFPVCYSALLDSLKDIDGEIGGMLQVYKVNRCLRTTYVYLPQLTSSAFTQARSLLPLTVKVVISGEVLAYTRTSLGIAMKQAQLNVETAKLVAYLFAAALLSFAAEMLAVGIRYLLRRAKVCRL
ncbi:MAG: hypothetical protein NC350_05690 [Corallococcus sp.]|nr:hypothetical protein [Corallococcus sp.]